MRGLSPYGAYHRGSYQVTHVGDAGDALADVAAGLERKARMDLYIKAAAVGVAAIGAIGLLAYALRG